MINYYVVRWGATNEDKVASQLVRYETNSFAIKNQQSHLTSNLAKKFAFRWMLSAAEEPFSSSSSRVTV
jgi:hypothetical protein